MFLLVNSLRKTADIIDGWTVGRLVIEDGIFVQLDNGNLVPVETNYLEVNNGGQWQRLGVDDFKKVTPEGWPAYASMDARMREAAI